MGTTEKPKIKPSKRTEKMHKELGGLLRVTYRIEYDHDRMFSKDGGNVHNGVDLSYLKSLLRHNGFGRHFDQVRSAVVTNSGNELAHFADLCNYEKIMIAVFQDNGEAMKTIRQVCKSEIEIMKRAFINGYGEFVSPVPTGKMIGVKKIKEAVVAAFVLIAIRDKLENDLDIPKQIDISGTFKDSSKERKIAIVKFLYTAASSKESYNIDENLLKGFSKNKIDELTQVASFLWFCVDISQRAARSGNLEAARVAAEAKTLRELRKLSIDIGYKNEFNADQWLVSAGKTKRKNV